MTFITALLFKESAISLPLVLATWAVLAPRTGPPCFARLRRAASSTLAHALAGVAYVGLRYGGGRHSPFTMGTDQPYRMALDPVQFFSNLTTYLSWSLPAIVPGKLYDADSTDLFIGLSLMAIAAGVLVLHRRAGRRKNGEESSTAGLPLFLLLWYLAGILPFLLLAHHRYRYYLLPSPPAFLTLGIVLFRSLLPRLRPRGRIVQLTAVALTVTTICWSTDFFHGSVDRGLNQRPNPGVDTIIRKGVTVSMVWQGLSTRYPRLPRDAVIVLEGVNLHSFQAACGLRSRYGDRSLKVYDRKRLGVDRRGIFLEQDERDPKDPGADGFSAGREYLDPAITHFFRLDKAGFVKLDLDLVARAAPSRPPGPAVQPRTEGMHRHSGPPAAELPNPEQLIIADLGYSPVIFLQEH